ncbi:uncharacterized protein LOC62_03G003773 [Vanrija pseudolonga]|uniref:Uncharacterized protein n=1 Tax=Vanrija pseudolonga TaxID=143232 RepID=A0AAF1BQ32_9TREE|nr:hypothetical protein LOC62_03G003773 [Vanrija pseudolonga]
MPIAQVHLGTRTPTTLAITFAPNITAHIRYAADARGRFLPTVRDTHGNLALALSGAVRSTSALKARLLANALQHSYAITQLAALESALRALQAPASALASLDVWVVSSWAARARGEGGWSDAGLGGWDRLDERAREVMLRTAVRDGYAVLVAYLLRIALREGSAIELAACAGAEVGSALDHLARIGWAAVRSVREDAVSLLGQTR